MIEIGLGLLALCGAVVILMGAGDTLMLPVGDLFPLIGFRGTGLIILVGLLLIARGVYRLSLKRARDSHRHGMRCAGLACTALIITLLLGLGAPLLAEVCNIARVGGFPLGYYLSAQGVLVALVILAFIFAARHDAIDREDGGAGR